MTRAQSNVSLTSHTHTHTLTQLHTHTRQRWLLSILSLFLSKMSQKQLENACFSLKMATKQMARMSVQAEKMEKQEKVKVKKAMEKGNQEAARIHAENAIRQKSQALNYLRMSARLDGTATRVQTAVTMGRVTASMKTVVTQMDRAMKSMDLAKITQLMDQFERNFEDLDVQTATMEGAMQSSVTSSMPESQVDNLMQRVADEHGLEMEQELGVSSIPAGKLEVGQPTQEQEADLSERLKKLREQV
eukprot:CFRG6477T1